MSWYIYYSKYPLYMLVGFVHFGKKIRYKVKKAMNFWVYSGTALWMRVFRSNWNRSVV